nr:hypothetical protein [Niallia taxi]
MTRRGSGEFMLSIKRDYYAYLDELSVITILLPYMYHGGEANAFYSTGR